MTKVPTLDDIYELATRSARIPLEEVKKFPHGNRFDVDITIAPRDADCVDRLQLADPTMISELAEVHAEDFVARRQSELFPFQLICRRSNTTLNSIGTNIPAQLKGKAYNPLHMHPLDLADLGLQEGRVVRIQSRYDGILGVVESDGTLRRGIVSMTQGFGAQGEAAERNPLLAGSNLNLLIHGDEYDPISGIARMSAVPVAISAAGDFVTH
jgi:anaerobic selenocysteine-containing dehydrogenase